VPPTDSVVKVYMQNYKSYF